MNVSDLSKFFILLLIGCSQDPLVRPISIQGIDSILINILDDFNRANLSYLFDPNSNHIAKFIGYLNT